MGASVGIFIALIVLLLSRVWLEVTSGKMKGSEFILDKFVKKNGPSAFIGSSPLKSDIVLPDPDVDPQHALLKGEDSHFNLKDLSLSGTYINGKKIEITTLRKNQVIKVGNTELVYHERK
jgi:predicted component of type VI protein secretion system